MEKQRKSGFAWRLAAGMGGWSQNEQMHSQQRDDDIKYRQHARIASVVKLQANREPPECSGVIVSSSVASAA